MSRILRRPMFRGGSINSEGTGITSGLDSRRQGYADGPDEQGVQPSIFQDIYDIFNPSNETIVKRLQANQPQQSDTSSWAQSIYDVINPSTETIVKRLQERQKAQGEPLIKTQSYREEQKRIAKAAEDKALIDKANAEKIANAQKNYGQTVPEEKTKTEDLETIYEKYLPMFQKNLGADQEELTRQKYLELSKFGLNLLRQPAGPLGGKPNLFGAIAAAAEKPLEGYSNILTKESQAKQLPKQLALQAALTEVQPGTLGKQIKDMVRMGVAKNPSEAYDLIQDKTVNAANRLKAQIEIGNLFGQQLQMQFKNEIKNKKIDPDVLAIAGAQIAQHNNNPKGQKIEITDVEILPANPIEGRIYLIPSGPGAGKVGKYKAGKLIYPGESGF
jgi:hypothetical protein